MSLQYDIYDCSFDDCENVEFYRPDGLHPIHLEDKLHDDRYTVLHKLGYGSASTVWLARDHVQKEYVALKVLSAIATRHFREVDIQNALRHRTGPTLHHSITKILNSFNVQGPNGKHLCVVFELIGPSLATLRDNFKIRPPVLRKLCQQLVCVLAHLHNNDIAFGDLSTSNILLRLKNLSSYSTEELLEMLGTPVSHPVSMNEGKEEHKDSAPKECYPPVNFDDIDTSLLEPKIALTDLNEAVDLQTQSTINSREKQDAINPSYASPEWFFRVDTKHTKAGDIWSLACCLFEMRTNTQLLAGMFGCDASQYLDLLGQVPEQWLARIRENADEDPFAGIDPDEVKDGEDTLKQKLETVGDWSPWHTMTREERINWLTDRYGEEHVMGPDFNLEEEISCGPPPPARLSDEEFADFYDLLSQMLRYLPEDRIAINKILQHPWLNKDYTDLDPPAEWISTYEFGRDTRQAVLNMSDLEDMYGEDDDDEDAVTAADSDENVNVEIEIPQDEDIQVQRLEEEEDDEPFFDAVEYEEDGDEQFQDAVEYLKTEETTTAQSAQEIVLKDSEITISAQQIGFTRPPEEVDNERFIYYAIIEDDDSHQLIITEFTDSDTEHESDSEDLPMPGRLPRSRSQSAFSVKRRLGMHRDGDGLDWQRPDSEERSDKADSDSGADSVENDESIKHKDLWTITRHTPGAWPEEPDDVRS